MDFLASDEGRLTAAAVLQVILIILLVKRHFDERKARRAGAPSESQAVGTTSETAAPGAALPTAPPPPPTGRERLRQALAKSREALRGRLESAFAEPELEKMLPALEEALVSADVGIRTAGKLLESVRRRLAGNSRPTEAAAREALCAAIEEILGNSPEPERNQKPWVILVVGVNGVGKTTTIGKLAAKFTAEGKKVLLVAGDTFRAAAIDQLGIWAERVGADIVKHQSGSDPAAVAFDGMKAAEARGADIVIVDTAGRLHTRENLMEELKKVRRVIDRALPGAPHEVLLVLDATTGQNALNQAKVFTGATGVTGVVLTKLDGSAKGGASLAVREELGIPVRYVGVGEGVADFQEFDAPEFARDLVGVGDRQGAQIPEPHAMG